jgi:hypothetical protein
MRQLKNNYLRMKILVCPLNWGLGHATRCVPIIQHLIDAGHTPVLVSDGYPLAFLQKEFPTLRTIEFPSYSITYSKGSSQIFAMMRSLPAIIFGIIKEHLWLKSLLKNETFDQVISDNRFGMWNKRLHSIYITHQLMVKMPSLLKPFEPIVWWMHRQFIHQYNECWVPDVANNENSLSGDLSHKYPLPRNAKFIGLLSRFSLLKNLVPNRDYHIVAVLSGVEPQRSILERQLIDRFQSYDFQTLIVCGQPIEKEVWSKTGTVHLVSHLSTTALASSLLGAEKIISRSGYSTIMDLKTLNCLHKAELIPTPGQTEQLYLAILHNII